MIDYTYLIPATLADSNAPSTEEFSGLLEGVDEG
jgi:hypothetical protein